MPFIDNKKSRFVPEAAPLLRLRELALGHVHLVAVQLVDVRDHLGALDRQQDKAGGHFRSQGARYSSNIFFMCQ